MGTSFRDIFKMAGWASILLIVAKKFEITDPRRIKADVREYLSRKTSRELVDAQLSEIQRIRARVHGELNRIRRLNNRLSVRSVIDDLNELIKGREEELANVVEDADARLAEARTKIGCMRASLDSGTSRSIVKELVGIEDFELGGVQLSELDKTEKELAEAKVRRVRAGRQLELLKFAEWRAPSDMSVVFDGMEKANNEWFCADDRVLSSLVEELRKAEATYRKYERISAAMRLAQVGLKGSGVMQRGEVARLMEEMELVVDPDVVFQTFLKRAFRWAKDSSVPSKSRNVK
jgi:hypothetical protein